MMRNKIPLHRNHHTPWTIRDIKFIEENYGKLPTKDIAATLGRSISAVRKIAHSSGVGKAASLPWTDAERALIREHYDRGPDRVHLMLPGRTKLAINSQASKMGVTNSDWSDEERQYLKKHYGSMPTNQIAATLGRSISGLRSVVQGMGLGRKAKTRGRPWTERELSVLRMHYGRGNWIVNVQNLLAGRTRGAIGTQASKMGITETQSWQPEEIRILRIFYPELGAKIAEKLPHRTVPAIKAQAAKLGLRYRNRIPRQTPITPWSSEELNLLEINQDLSIGKLQAILPGRSRYAIEKLRARIRKKR